MKHGESSNDRMKATGMAGHVAVSRLMRRLLHVGGQEPGPIEVSWVGSQGGMWSRFAREALGEAPSMLHATRADLYRVCRLVVRALDTAIERGAKPRTDWYPDGWREAYDAIKASERGQPDEPVLASPPLPDDRGHTRHEALDAIAYVAEQLRVPPEQVLEMLGQNLHTLTGEHYRTALDLLQSQAAE